MRDTINPTLGENAHGQDLLRSSWNEGSAKQRVMNFVSGVTAAGDPHFTKQVSK